VSLKFGIRVRNHLSLKFRVFRARAVILLVYSVIQQTAAFTYWQFVGEADITSAIDRTLLDV